MQELTDLENKMQEFMKVAQKDIEEQEKILLEPIQQKVKQAIQAQSARSKTLRSYTIRLITILFVTPTAVNATPLK